MFKKRKSVLVVAAHPDDEVLGCGGTIAKLSKRGFKVNVIFISDGVSSRSMTKKKYLKQLRNRQKSCLRTCKILGLTKPIFYNLPDNALDSVPLLNIVKIIEKHISKIKPEIIFTHFYSCLFIYLISFLLDLLITLLQFLRSQQSLYHQ